MILFPRGIWRYALLIVLLLILAAYASLQTIHSIEELVNDVQAGFRPPVETEVFRVLHVPILALTMGFLFLAGALGVWAIRTTTVVESRRRVGRLVEGLEYIRDALLAVDERGRVTGMNPAAHALTGRGAEEAAGLRDVFPCLNAADAAILLDNSEAHEVECVARGPDVVRALRFRSQPSGDMNLILVSDVTGQRAREMRDRQVARLQLIGRIARGVAHDFNNILCAISGHAALLDRQKNGERPDPASLKAIAREAQRGAGLASQLLDLSRTGSRGNPCEDVAGHVAKAVQLVKVAIDPAWQIVTDVHGTFGPVALTDPQVEQAVLNLALLTADELAAPGFIHIRALRPGKDSLVNVGDEFAAVVVIAAYGDEPELPDAQLHPETQTTVSEAGVIQSVIRSMLEEVGGRLDVMVTPGGRHTYRICLPRYSASEGKMSALAGVPEELRMYIANWQVLLASPDLPSMAKIEEQLNDLGMVVERAGDVVAALQHVEAGRELSAMVMDRRLLGEEADALVRAIIKLRPAAGLLVLCEDTSSIPPELKQQAVFEKKTISPEAVLQALVRARELAGRRVQGGHGFVPAADDRSRVLREVV